MTNDRLKLRDGDMAGIQPCAPKLFGIIADWHWDNATGILTMITNTKESKEALKKLGKLLNSPQ